MPSLRNIGLALGALAAAPAFAHPHVFIDGGVDFVLREGAVLEALEVTWLYDEFETLYILSSYDISLNDEGGLDEADRQQLVGQQREWPEDFEGTAHLTVEGEDIALERPSALGARLVEGRLELTFTRQLERPIALEQKDVELAFYEATYFYALSIANAPQLLGEPGGCAAQVVPFEPDTQLAALEMTLFELGREETPAIENVGALFADRIALRCD
ncbi:DUF1007 family protein [Pontivivens ytuae]|uniref:DUF1007 family protein n=2 Tax=Pontivivens ytuae TaxID=2789856 RepID=A0A7S9LVB6_9RHOB|nr:DUF1007 family protein [Pontivivens ytuae]